MNFQILLILSLVGFGAAGLNNSLDGLDSELKAELEGKYKKLGEWVKEKIEQGLEPGKDKLSNVKVIAREIVDHGVDESKDVATEASDFLRPYKADLGVLYGEVRATLEEVLKIN
ncbi:Protein CBG03646 [Caenorhabditis briggsae]|uniref:Protein CBG03646 n=1 Tax=Caenorhabditis briggsae TaxID=6238 RepID=A8WVI3_CAEBR|nr:Protein CBG03646 [Caenorhabditis briggsae]CAP24494.1 Protein CBG03646 [Caenorhabditis briggsae]